MKGNTHNDEIEALLRNTASLPSLPSVALRVLELGEDPYVGLSEIAGVIANDPVLSAKVLKAANSPLYAARRQIDNLRQAISLLGFNTSITLALSFSLEPPSHAGCVDKLKYWRRSLVAGVAARALVEQLNGGESGRYFLAALLQDIGMLVLERVEPQRYASMLDAGCSHEAQAQAEIETFGFDHAVIGMRLLQRWRVPEPLSRAVRCSHDIGALGAPVQASLLERCVYLSGRFADRWVGPETPTQDSGLMHAVKTQLGLSPESFDAVVERIAELLPHYSALFEIQLAEDSDVNAILQEARDSLMLRNLKTIQEASEYKARNEMLETRNRQLEQQTYADPLTGLLNRGRLDEILAREFEAAGREGWPLTVAFLDVDHFKRVNDGYGHHAGDEVLVSVANLLSDYLRQTDIVGRYGGEEFVLVLPGTGEGEALALLERLRRMLATHEHKVADSVIGITVSIGVATYLCGQAEGQDMETVNDLLRASDRAMYAAKREGRNRTLVYRRSDD